MTAYRHPHPRIQSQYGFTLIELMVTIAVMGIIASIAVPGFQNQIVESRMKDTTSVFYNALKEAKTESFLHKSVVTVNYDATTRLLSISDSNGDVISEYTINASSTFVADPVLPVTFTRGRRATATNITICDSNSNSERPRQVAVDAIANVSTTRAGTC